MSPPTTTELLGGYWGAHPSPIVDAYAGAWTAFSGPSSRLLSGTSPKTLTLSKADRVSPGPNGSPAYGYHAPDDVPVWIAVSLRDGPLLSQGPDFTVSDDYIWFTRDPFFDASGRLDYIDGAFVEILDIWYGTAAAAAPETPPLAATAYALFSAIATATDSPATGSLPETVLDIWADARGDWSVVTDIAGYRLPAVDVPSVEVGDILPPGSPIGAAWAIDKLDFRTETPYITTPAGFTPAVTGPVTWYAESSPLVVDTVDDRTRVRFAIGIAPDEFDAFWDAAMANGVENDRTLAQALDTRADPSGDPDASSLPAVISPMRFLAKELLQGLAYRLILRPDRFGPDAVDVEAVTIAARKAAGSYTALFVWEDEEPDLPPVSPT